MDKAGLRLVASAPAVTVAAAADPGAFQVRCIEDYSPRKLSAGFPR